MAITTQNSGACLVGGPRRKDENEMVRVKITSGVLIDGEHASPGKIVEIERGLANTLFAGNKAVPVADAPEKPATRVPEKLMTRAPDVPKTGKRKGK